MPRLGLARLLLLLLTLIRVPAAAQSAPAIQPELRPGDLLKIEIWREEDLSGEFIVNEAGVVTLPLLGERRVSATPLVQLKDELITAYRAELRNPSITITALRRIYVFGAVTTPGQYAADPTISLAGVIALAGGVTPQGDIRRVRIIRSGEVVVSGTTQEVALSALDVRSGDQIFVGQRGWFERNSNFLISTSLAVAGIVISLVR